MDAVQTPDLSLVIRGFIWSLLSVNAWLNPIFRTTISTVERLEELFTSAGFSFCPGLHDALNSGTPPTVGWFKSLPTAIPRTCWGVYVLVLEKSGSTPILYFGSGTEKRRGLPIRIADHRGNRLVPIYVGKAREDGYKITHIAPLATCPIPRASMVFPYRVLVVALEGAFSYVFWGMHHRDRPYNFGNNCPWRKEQFEYLGACSHNPLLEPIHRSG